MKFQVNPKNHHLFGGIYEFLTHLTHQKLFIDDYSVLTVLIDENFKITELQNLI